MIESKYKEVLTEVCVEYQPDRFWNPFAWDRWQRWMIAKGFAAKLGLKVRDE